MEITFSGDTGSKERVVIIIVIRRIIIRRWRRQSQEGW